MPWTNRSNDPTYMLTMRMTDEDICIHSRFDWKMYDQEKKTHPNLREMEDFSAMRSFAFIGGATSIRGFHDILAGWKDEYGFASVQFHDETVIERVK